MDSDWRSKTASLVGSLGHIFETGLYSDVAFLVGEEEFRINAHKTILSARSEPLAAMFHERWNSATEQEIKMPKNNAPAVKQFLKYLYTDVISFENVEIDDILEITHLAHMYQVQKLLDQCVAHLKANINENNCLQIHKSCQHVEKSLSDKALQFFLTNLVPKSKSNDAYLTWDYDTMEKILEDDREHVPESILFRALLKWRNVDSARNEDFQKLSRLIRFPTMSTEDFASEIVTSGVLTKDEMLEVFCYISMQKGSVKFPTKRRNPFVLPAVQDSKHLKICGNPKYVNFIEIRQMLEDPSNFHKFRFVVLSSASSATTDIKLYGIKFFSSGINNSDMMAYLQKESYRIKVTVDLDPVGVFVSTELEKSVTELNQLQMRAYFDAPLVISRNQNYSISTTLIPGVGAYGHDYFSFELPQLNPSVLAVSFDGVRGKLATEALVGSYSLIDELLFLPSADSPDPGCNIS